MLFVAPVIADNDVWVDGYTRSDGTTVKGHYRSAPNNTVIDNFSYYGNINPYTGAIGTNKYKNDPSSTYYKGDFGSIYLPDINLKPLNTPSTNNSYLALRNKNLITEEAKQYLKDNNYWFVDTFMDKALERLQINNNLSATGLLDMKTLELMNISLE